jgi:hypothetical protein
MIKARHIAVILIVACLAGTATEATAAEPHGRAYLFRGMIDLIDWRMDQLAGRINRTGVAANISSHLMWRSVADQAISDYRRDPKPITAIGHSIGGDAAVEFAEHLEAAHVPVSLLITYDPNRFAHNVPANVHRYINLYQSSNVLGGGDLAPGRGFHGNYASFNLKNRSEVIHVNLDKFPHIQEILASKIRSAGATSEGREYGPQSKNYDDDLYAKYLKLTVYTAGKLAPYQTPMLATVKVGGDRDNPLMVREGVTSKQVMEMLRLKLLETGLVPSKLVDITPDKVDGVDGQAQT